MASRIKPKNRSADGTAPTTVALIDGELAVNSFAKRIYLRVGGTVVLVANYFSGAWSDLTGTPTTLSGYGITDGVANTRNIVAGNGLTGGGDLSSNRTFTLGTPGTLTSSTTNAVTSTSHTHALSDVDAATLVGWPREQNASTVNTVAARNSSGDIFARLFRSEYGSTNADVNFIMTQVGNDGTASTNNYMRPSTPAQVKTALALDSRDVPMNSGVVNSTATLGPTRLNTVVEKSNTTAYTHTIATTTGGVAGDAITFMNSGTAGNLTIAQGTSITIVRNGVTGNVTVAPGSVVTLVRSATSNKWVG